MKYARALELIRDIRLRLPCNVVVCDSDDGRVLRGAQ